MKSRNIAEEVKELQEDSDKYYELLAEIEKIQRRARQQGVPMQVVRWE